MSDLAGVLVFSAAVAVVVIACTGALVALTRPARQEPDDGLALVSGDDAAQPAGDVPRPGMYRGRHRAVDVAVAVPARRVRGVAEVHPRPTPPRRTMPRPLPRWQDPTRTTVTMQIIPPPTARGVARVGSGRRV